jgi:hypothetical protein
MVDSDWGAKREAQNIKTQNKKAQIKTVIRKNSNNREMLWGKNLKDQGLVVIAA